MANLKFGSSFLSGINPALDNLTKIGAAPTDQQLAEDALYGVRGTRNPLARSVGGLLSALGSPVDVRTSSERISQDLSQIQNPSSNEGLIEALKIQNQYLQSPTARMANLAKIKEIQDANKISLNTKIDLLKEFTPESVEEFLSNGATDVSLLKRLPETSLEKISLGNEITIRTEKGHVYTRRVAYKGGKPTVIYTPIGDAPKLGEGEVPEGDIDIISPVTGVSGEDASRISGDKELSVGYARERIKAQSLLPTVRASLTAAKRGLELLSELDTGGFDTAFVRKVNEFFGSTPENEAEFAFIAAQTVLDGLAAFSGAISEGERLFLQEMYQELKASKGKNKAILTSLINRYVNQIEALELKAITPSFEEYNEKMDIRNQERKEREGRKEKEGSDETNIFLDNQGNPRNQE